MNTLPLGTIAETVISLFEKRVRISPSALALKAEGRELSFDDLNKISNKTARYLIENGIGQNDKVAFCHNRSVDALIDLIAILKIGAVYVPLSADMPEQRRDFVIQDSSAKLVLFSENFSSLFSNIDIRGLSTTRSQGVISSYNDDNLDIDINSEDILWLIYTSGTSGKPKGVLGSQRACMTRLNSLWQLQPFEENEVGFQHTAFTTVDSYWEIFGPLLCGNTLCIIEDDIVADVEKLVPTLAREGIKRICLVPSKLALILDIFPSLFDVAPRLDCWVVSGEALTFDLCSKFYQKTRSAKLFNQYGLTESCADITSYDTSLDFEKDHNPRTLFMPVGEVFRGSSYCIVDSSLSAVVDGEAGELCIWGASVCSGYLNSTELFQKKFFTLNLNNTQVKAFRTGDKFRVIEGKGLVHLGRIDNQINLRGFRIEPGEIEAVIASYTGVEHVGIILHEEKTLQKSLLAFVTLEKNERCVPLNKLKKNLNHHLSQYLPRYMFPNEYLVLNEMPLTSSGKIDRKNLQSMLPNLKRGDLNKFEGAKGHLEKLIDSIFSKLFEFNEFGATTNFFEIGGNSLLAMRAVAGMQKELSMEVPLRLIFEYPTVRELANYLDQSLVSEEGEDTFLGIQPQVRPGVLPMSSIQERLWVLDRLGLGGNSYNMFWNIKISGELDLLALEKSINSLLDRHEILRSRFQSQGGDGIQIVEEHVDCKLDVLPIDGKDLESYLKPMAQWGFDLQTGPLYKFRLFTFGEQRSCLSLVVHHIVFDGWSQGVFIDELCHFYDSFVNNKASNLPDLPIQYADFSLWQKDQLESKLVRKQLRYWRKQLSGAPAALELPTDRPRLAVPSYEGNQVSFHLPIEATNRLRDLAQDRGATLYMVLLSCLSLVLRCWSGQKDIVIGSPIAGRMQQETQRLIGFFVNTLALRIDVSSEQSFAGLLEQVRGRVLDAFANQDVPFDKVVEEIQPVRDLSRQAIFQVMFALHQLDYKLEMAGLALEECDYKGEGAKFDLNFELQETPDGIGGYVEYSTDLWDHETMVRLVGHFNSAISSVLANPEERVSKLSIINVDELKKIDAWNGTNKEIFKGGLTHKLFEEQVLIRPENIALYCEQIEIDYELLNEKANQLAHYFLKEGLKSGDLVGVCTGRNVDMLVSLLAIFKAGGAYVPLDPIFPVDRLGYILKDCQPRFVLTDDESRTKWQKLEALKKDLSWTRIDLDTDKDNWKLCSRENLSRVAVKPQSIGYVIYTSGSTGRPKGVAVSHEALANLLHSMSSEPGFSSEDRLLAVTTLSFDIAGLELFLPLIKGGTIVLANQEQAQDPEWLIQAIEEKAITVMQATPVTWRRMIDSDWQGSNKLRALCGGEALNRDLAARLAHRVKSLWNMYGPTETTIWSSCCEIKSSEKGSVSIGQPIANTKLHVLDEERREVPIGVIGELYIGGMGLAMGYLNREELTKERFVERVLEFGSKERIYKTGDLVRRLSNGTLEYHGRNDFQVKVRGLRIELGEIESALMELPQIDQAVVTVREENEEDSRLVGYLVCLDNKELDSGKLRSYLTQLLPSYMVPSTFVKLEVLPLTLNDKVDRKKLPAPDYVDKKKYIAPETEIEIEIARIFSNVLGLDRVGALDNFFEIGGHSLLAMRAVAAIKDGIGIQVPLRLLFETANVRDLAGQIVGADQAIKGGASELSISKKDRPAVLPMSSAQERLWILDRLGLGGSVYNMVRVFAFSGELNVKFLERAINTVFERHESLRTRFEENDGIGRQIVDEHKDFKLEICFLDDQPKRELELAGEWKFDLSINPLCQLKLFTVSATENHLSLVLHHIIGDGTSIDIIAGEICTLYSAYVNEYNPSLPQLPIQYVDYSLCQREWLSSAPIEKQLNYWKNKLLGAPTALELPVDKPRPPISTYQGAHVPFSLSKDLSNKLKNLANSEGVTLYMVLLSALSVVLSRWSGQKEVIIGSPIAGRTQKETERLVGFFINTLALRVDLSKEGNFNDLLKQVKKTAIEAYANQDVPFDKVVEVVQPARDLSRQAIFQAMFAFHNPEQKLEIPNASLVIHEGQTGTSKFDLSLELTELNGAISGHLEYSTDIWDLPTAQRLVGHYKNILTSVLENTRQDVRKLRLSDANEYQQMMGWNSKGYRNYKQNLLHTSFEKTVQVEPERVAIKFGDQEISYAVLNRQANQLARYLMFKGIREGTCVGVCMARGFDMVVSLLAILKAGGSYVPIDHTFPLERMKYMVENCQPKVILTDNKSQITIGKLDRKIALWTEINLEKDQDEWSTLSGENIDNIDINLDSTAYVIYTSGSTGRPKGVAVSHGSMINLLHSIEEQPGLASTDIVLATTTLSFDVSIVEFFLPLMVGARMILASDQEAKDQSWLIKTIDKEHVTFMQATPVVWGRLLDAGWKGAQRLKALCAGEAMTVDLAKNLSAKVQRLWNLYGPTEATVYSTCHEISDEEGVSFSSTSVPIGRPTANTELYVLDENGYVAPIGIYGELFIGGIGVAKGYQNREDLTNDRFITKTINKIKIRLYKTGDIVRWLSNGELEYQGRNDFQVKVRGLRIELGEIEKAILKYGSISQSIVVTRIEGLEDVRLIAYVQPNANCFIDVVELRQYLGKFLPAYMLPSAIVVLEDFPLTPSEKVDRNALPQPKYIDESNYVKPITSLEKIISSIFCEVHNQKKVGVVDNFFEIGGNSLLAMRAVAGMQKELSMEVPLRLIFEYPTVRELANYLDQSLVSEEGEDTFLGIQPQVRPGVLPMSSIQERLWVLDRLGLGGNSYNMFWNIKISGELDLLALEKSINSLLDRHEILRSRFQSQGGDGIQIVEEHVDCKLDVLPIDGKDLESYLKPMAQWGFDLQTGPLYKFRLFTFGEQRSCLSLVVHHIVFDGWSQGVFIDELCHFYDSFVNNKASNLPDLPIQYADFSLWQKDQLESKLVRKQLRYWRKQLSGAPAALELPTDRPRLAVPSYEGNQVSFHLPIEATNRLRDLAQDRGATLYMVLLSCLSLVLRCWSGQKDIVIGSPIAGRMQQETQRLIGFFVNTLALRIDVSSEQSFAGLLEQVRGRVLDAFANQDVPFDKVVEEIQPVRDLSRQAIFQVMFALHQLDYKLEMAGLALEECDYKGEGAKFDLNFELQETPDGIGGYVEYSTDLWDHETMVRLVGHFNSAISSVLANPEERVSKLSIINVDELKKIDAWNGTNKEIFKGGLTHKLFEEQVLIRPENIALYCEQIEIDYELLNEKANQLAHYFLKEGLKSGDLVGVCTGRNVDMLVSLLAIFKAGGAYVPLDPIFPVDRLGYILKDCQPRFVLTDDESRTKWQKLEALKKDLSWTRIDLDTDKDNWKLCSRENLSRVAVKPQSIGYVIYTSGSTGRPKGVAVSHEALANLLHSMSSEPGFSSEDRLLAVTTLSFDIAGLELFLPLIKGGTIVLANQEQAQDPEWLIQAIEEKAITVMQATPVTWRRMIDSDWQGSNKLRALCGGEALNRDLAARLAHRVKSLWNMYGPTETTIWSSCCEIKSSEKGSVSIGQPIANTKLHVLDEERREVPIGVIGELYIGGMGLAMGYLNREELTKERFVERVLEFGSKERIYKTGDLVRRLSNGTLEYHGRNDFQVKVRGLRIELGEIESALMELPQIDQAVVTVREENEEDSRLVGYLVCLDNKELDSGKLRSYLTQLLPSYMVPSTFVKLEVLPLTLNDKVDRKKLPAPDYVDKKKYIAPETEIEIEIARIFSNVLGLDRVGALDNFFEIGGHSLLAMRAVARINSYFNTTLPLRSMFESPTPKGLAVNVDIIRQVSHPKYNALFRNDKIASLPNIAKLKSGETDQNIFLLHPGGGGGVLTAYAPLIERLGAQFNIYGISALDLEGKTLPKNSIEEIAACYSNQISQIQMEGPFNFIGWSAGGLIAYEIARQLTNDGHNISLLAMLDSKLLDSIKVEPWSEFLEFLEFLEFGTNLVSIIESHGWQSMTSPERVHRIWSNLAENHIIGKPIELDELMYFHATFSILLRSYRSYDPLQYPNKIEFFIPEDAEYHSTDDVKKWRRKAGGEMKTHTVAGNHYSMMLSPNINSVGDILCNLLS